MAKYTIAAEVYLDVEGNDARAVLAAAKEKLKGLCSPFGVFGVKPDGSLVVTAVDEEHMRAEGEPAWRKG